MPSFRRFCWVTVQIERTNSYSTGVSRSMNTGGTVSRAAIHGDIEKDAVFLADAVVERGHVVRLDAVALLGQGGLVAEAVGVVNRPRADSTPPMARSSSRTASRFSRVCT